MDVLSFLSWYPKLLARYQISKVPDCDLTIFRQVCLALGGEEVVDLFEEWLSIGEKAPTSPLELYLAAKSSTVTLTVVLADWLMGVEDCMMSNLAKFVNNND